MSFSELNGEWEKYRAIGAEYSVDTSCIDGYQAFLRKRYFHYRKFLEQVTKLKIVELELTQDSDYIINGRVVKDTASHYFRQGSNVKVGLPDGSSKEFKIKENTSL